jgi:hypothetical protein
VFQSITALLLLQTTDSTKESKEVEATKRKQTNIHSLLHSFIHVTYHLLFFFRVQKGRKERILEKTEGRFFFKATKTKTTAPRPTANLVTKREVLLFEEREEGLEEGEEEEGGEEEGVCCDLD